MNWFFHFTCICLYYIIDSKGKALTAKQQAWWDSLGVRHPQSERKENVKLRKEVRQLTGEKELLICLKCNENIFSSTQLKYYNIKWIYFSWSVPHFRCRMECIHRCREYNKQPVSRSRWQQDPVSAIRGGSSLQFCRSGSRRSGLLGLAQRISLEVWTFLY